METLNADIFTGDFFPSGSMWESEVEQYDMGFHGLAEDHNPAVYPPTIPAAAANLHPGANHDERLKKEADGLFVGMALLNELDPWEGVDEGNIGSGPGLTADYSLFSLRPEPLGRGIICTRNLSYKCSTMFPCTVRDIQAHIRDCGVPENIEYKTQFLETVEMIQESPASMTLITSLQQRCERIQEGLSSIPEIDDYLCQLEILPGEVVNCTLRGCSSPKNIRTSAIKTHFRIYHCSNFEGSLNCDFVCKIGDVIDEKCRRPWTQYLMSIVSTSKSQSTRRVSLQEQKPSWEQMRVLRTLRSRFIVNHRLFLSRTAASDSDRLKRLRSSCRLSSKLLDTGILTLQEIMNDKSPSTLKEVLSFISLSNAMMWTMQARGHPVKPRLSKVDLGHCRMRLRDAGDRLAFDELESLMWADLVDDDKPKFAFKPNYRTQEHWCDIDCSILDFTSCSMFPIPIKPDKHLRSAAETLLDASQAHEDFRFGDWLNFPADDLFIQKTHLHSENSIRETSRMGCPEIPQDVEFHNRTTAKPPEIQPVISYGDQYALTEPQSLSYTVLFMQCISFLIFWSSILTRTFIVIGGIGTLLQHLSGSNESCVATERGQFTGRDIAGFSRFVEVSKFRILNVLCLDPELSNFRAVFNTAAKLLEAGWLQAVEDVERYLICVVRLFADSRSSYLTVVSKILNCSLNAVKDERMDDEYRYRRDHQDAELYNSDYMARRQEEAGAAYIDDEMVSEHPPYSSFGEINLQPTIEIGEYSHQGLASTASSENWRGSETTTSPTDFSPVSRSSGVEKASSESSSLNRVSASRRCDVEGCGKVFTGIYSADGLARHKREKHSNRRSFSCPAQSCIHTSKRLHNLRGHWESKHVDMSMPSWLVATASCGGGGVKRKREDSLIG